jgi:dTDP-4-amino-4,6-dideoxygalactose transaminase
LDLVNSHRELEKELTSVFYAALSTASFVGGPMVEHFEHDFGEFCEAKYCVGVGNGTDALRFALIAAGIRVGDAVVTVPNTFIATTEAISQAGAVPEFVDVDEKTGNMDVGKLAEFLEKHCDAEPLTGRPISRRTRRPVTAVVPVHLYGRMVDMDPLLDLAQDHGLVVVEDACQAHGAAYFSEREQCWKKAGAIGRAAAFSFYPGKNLGACGEAGAVTSNDESVAQTVRILRDHGQAQKYSHLLEGYNGRLDAMQAGFLRAKLPYLSTWNEKRCEAAERYGKLLAPLSDAVTMPGATPWVRSVFHLYVIRTAQRDQLRSYMAEAGIETGIHYPIPLHLQEAYKHLGYREGDFPVSERLAAEILSLPMFPSIRAEQQTYVVEQVAKFVLPTSSLMRGRVPQKVLTQKTSV